MVKEENMEQMITESFVVEKIKEFLINKENGNWHEEKVKESKLHGHGVDILLVGGKRNSEYFLLNVRVNLIPNLPSLLIKKDG